jgi:hypothetical protein
LQDQLHHGLLQAVGNSEVALNGVADETSKLDHERIVEAQCRAQRLAVLKRRLLTDHRTDWIADIAEERKSHECDDKHHDGGLHDPADDKGKHRTPWPVEWAKMVAKK